MKQVVIAALAGALFGGSAIFYVQSQGPGWSSNSDANCGIGKYTCVGEQYTSDPAFAPTGGFNNITGDEVDVVEALAVPGWWKTTITAGKGAFTETEFCTKNPSATDRLTMTAGSQLLCVTGSRVDQDNPHVAISYYQTTCDSFTKVITAGSATNDNKLIQPALSRVTCNRVTASAQAATILA